MTYLFSPAYLGSISTHNRIVMAPMTRSRAREDGVPSAMMADYYAQRATAGAIITEATQISAQGRGHSRTPGIHTAPQINGWRDVTDAVHDAGGMIVAQLWHAGAASHPALLNAHRPIGPSAVAWEGQVWLADPDTGTGRMVDSVRPRQAQTSDIRQIIDEYRQAAFNAMAAGFDGVEIHAANGSLIDQFLCRHTNRRSDGYGGTASDRCKLLLDVVAAVCEVVSPAKVGVRLSPQVTQVRRGDGEVVLTALAAAQRLDQMDLGFLHIAEADDEVVPGNLTAFRKALRLLFKGSIIVAGRYDRQRAVDILATGMADFVAFGRPFIGNPDLVRRYHDDLLTGDYDPATLYGGDEHGLTDYPDFDAWLGKLRAMMLN